MIDAGGLCSGTRPFLAAPELYVRLRLVFYLQMALRADSAGRSPSLLPAPGSFQDGRLGDGGLWQEAVQTVKSA